MFRPEFSSPRRLLRNGSPGADYSPWRLPRRDTPAAATFTSPIRLSAKDPRTLVFVHGWISHIEHVWEEPRLARFFNRLASFTRLILLDKRGTGMSDPVPLDRLPTLEERMDDVRAVMDAAKSERAVLFAISEAGRSELLL